MIRPLAYIRPDLTLTVIDAGQTPVRIQLDRSHALALLRDLASALAEHEAEQ